MAYLSKLKTNFKLHLLNMSFCLKLRIKRTTHSYTLIILFTMPTHHIRPLHRNSKMLLYKIYCSQNRQIRPSLTASRSTHFGNTWKRRRGHPMRQCKWHIAHSIDCSFSKYTNGALHIKHSSFITSRIIILQKYKKYWNKQSKIFTLHTYKSFAKTFIIFIWLSQKLVVPLHCKMCRV